MCYSDTHPAGSRQKVPSSRTSSEPDTCSVPVILYVLELYIAKSSPWESGEGSLSLFHNTSGESLWGSERGASVMEVTNIDYNGYSPAFLGKMGGKKIKGTETRIKIEIHILTLIERICLIKSSSKTSLSWERHNYQIIRNNGCRDISNPLWNTENWGRLFQEQKWVILWILVKSNYGYIYVFYARCHNLLMFPIYSTYSWDSSGVPIFFSCASKNQYIYFNLFLIGVFETEGCIACIWGYVVKHLWRHKALQGFVLWHNRANICAIKFVSLCSWTHYIILLVNKSSTV